MFMNKKFSIYEYFFMIVYFYEYNFCDRQTYNMKYVHNNNVN